MAGNNVNFGHFSEHCFLFNSYFPVVPIHRNIWEVQARVPKNIHDLTLSLRLSVNTPQARVKSTIYITIS